VQVIKEGKIMAEITSHQFKQVITTKNRTEFNAIVNKLNPSKTNQQEKTEQEELNIQRAISALRKAAFRV
jgi:hypothetical protein